MGPPPGERDPGFFGVMGPPDLQAHGTPGATTGEVMHGPSDDDAGRRREHRMAYRELTMIDVREVLRRWQSQQSIKSIARGTCVDRKTIRRYLAAAQQLGIDKTKELSDAVVLGVAQYVQARPQPAPSDAHTMLAAQRERIGAWLDE